MANILSIAPYSFLPPTSGGTWGIFFSEKVLSVHNDVTTVSVRGNDMKDAGTYAFSVKNVLTDSRLRYLPYLLSGKLMRLARQYRPDYLFCHHHYLYPAALYVASRLRIPLYIRSHNIEAERFRTIGKWWWPLMKRFEQSAYTHADRVFFVTEEDAAWAMTHYHLPPEKAVVMPFPCNFSEVQQTDKDKPATARDNGLNPDVPWFVFMGVLDYAPNEEAVAVIVQQLYPRLKARGLDFEIVICGKRLNPHVQEAIGALPEVHYLGFVPDLNPILQHASVMLNPVISGGGVKTKVIESLSWNLSVVSAETGAIGIAQKYCGTKLRVVPDGDWDAMADAVIQAVQEPAHIPDAFFEHYYLTHVADRLQVYFQ